MKIEWRIQMWDGEVLRADCDAETKKDAREQAARYINCTHFILFRNGVKHEVWGSPTSLEDNYRRVRGEVEKLCTIPHLAPGTHNWESKDQCHFSCKEVAALTHYIYKLRLAAGCVNSHDQLVAALKKALNRVAPPKWHQYEIESDGESTYGEDWPLVEQIRTALAAAGESV